MEFNNGIIESSFLFNKANKSGDKKRKLENVKIKQLTTHDISFEHQLFFKEITEACVGCDETKRNVKFKTKNKFTI